MNNVVKKEQMGYWSMILLGINGIIGSGIFLLPNQAAKLIGSASIFVLLFDALLVISIALCFAQAATYFDRDGGPYLYAKDALAILSALRSALSLGRFGLSRRPRWRLLSQLH